MYIYVASTILNEENEIICLKLWYVYNILYTKHICIITNNAYFEIPQTWLHKILPIVQTISKTYEAEQ